MSSILSTIAGVFFFLSMGYLLSVTIGFLAHLFVQDFIDRHERQHHRRSGACSKTTDGE